MAAFKLGEPRKHRELHYGDVVVNVEGKQLKLVEGFLIKIKKKEFLVTSISCLSVLCPCLCVRLVFLCLVLCACLCLLRCLSVLCLSLSVLCLSVLLSWSLVMPSMR